MKENREADVINTVNVANQILEGDEYESAEEFINELYDLFENFSNMSHRVLRALKLQMPHKNAKIGLSNFIQNLMDEHGETGLDRKAIAKHVQEGFEYTVTQKAITDSLSFLVNNSKISRYWDMNTKKNMYKKIKLKRRNK